MNYYRVTGLLLCYFMLSNINAQQILVPEWSKGVLWYQIFPERFCNGDVTNDPQLADIKGSWPHNDTAAWEISPWTSDWYAMQPWEKENGQDIWYQLQRRRYGGDIQGIINKLDYIQALGVGAIYLNPLFMAPSLHKYDGAMYHHIEPTFGPDPEGDKAIIAAENPIDPSTWQWTSADKLALELIQECHKRNIKIIFDGVFNHLGRNSFAFVDVVKNQQNSIYKDWFTIKSWEDKTKGTTFQYEGWFGVPDLPEIREDSNGIVDGPKQYIFNCTQRWMAPDGVVANGIDGWRLDVAFCVDHDFWKSWRLHVKSINKDAYLTAEVVDKPEVVKPYLYGDEFDAVMNYAFAVIATEFFVNQQSQISVSAFDSLLNELRTIYGYDMSLVMQNLFDSHDTQRFTSFLNNPDVARFRTWGDYFNKTKANNKAYDTNKPDALAYQKQQLMALFQYTYPGAPMLYYGDEVGMWGANDPDCRKPMIWSDLQYEDEVYNWDGSKKTNPDKVFIEKELLAYYQSLGKLHQLPALQKGDFKPLLIDDVDNIYVYSRSYKGQKSGCNS
ncbi:MAG: glycoside hydrolase family 13 protein [Bacteroidetes bacterium]|nr:glycoside hydrolase family 13 protein [Bacteroidota bacterium]